MVATVRRQQPPITIRSSKAVELLRLLSTSGRSQAEIIEEALEHMADRRRSLAAALRPSEPVHFDWEPPRASMSSRDEAILEE
ncbi:MULTISPECIES: hypothetical protein [Sphingomonas]|jgi:hypothetical protein|uniref:Uncharacterized protein n=1 Tax=Sphingomonas turrisvirgatae TaxID=1888892 RepID=A0A1E3M0B7_9SPHN|nr:hypothetical protein [Sphingomonas turrisvirgatae]ODP38805.1 hypothetical protein BFL28_13520 [Sphingomonas turrisvirgatae]